MPEPLKEAQDTMVKLFKDIYFKAGAPLSYKDELQVRSTVATLVQAIKQDVIAQLPASHPPASAPRTESGGDPFHMSSVKPASGPAPAPTPEKKGFFSGLVKSKIVQSPHKKK